MKPELILIGGGGHCASCIDVIEQENKFTIAGFVDINDAVVKLLGYSLLGSDDDLKRLKADYDYAFVTVGQIKSPEMRMRLYENIKSLGFRLPAIVSPRAYVSKHASVGEGTIIMHDALINVRATIGNNCIINSKALIEHDAVVKDNCHISTAAIVNGGTIVRQGTFVGSNAVTREGVQTRENDFIKAGELFKGYA
ncbi:NeuD/PglB/VioB family sugar acetyltransferase [Devosia sp.]|uniref:NeuD/PglB/VioB family sugar acetyltransferase n=1 Tax=Devosia sp. TaxID=1871048 RepID=UPI00273691F6|nr:NeuD/PglB/VioB family sugar acetyltransferase [Devosia sp.]MDP2782318.1 NeuD/PglB/VioB family sugar acetyltransferase [Devosia sp.]